MLGKSAPILRYMAAKSPEGDKFYPADDLWMKANIDMWMDFSNTELKTTLAKIINCLRSTEGRAVADEEKEFVTE